MKTNLFRKQLIHCSPVGDPQEWFRYIYTISSENGIDSLRGARESCDVFRAFGTRVIGTMINLLSARRNNFRFRINFGKRCLKLWLFPYQCILWIDITINPIISSFWIIKLFRQCVCDNARRKQYWSFDFVKALFFNWVWKFYENITGVETSLFRPVV